MNINSAVRSVGERNLPTEGRHQPRRASIMGRPLVAGKTLKGGERKHVMSYLHIVAPNVVFRAPLAEDAGKKAQLLEVYNKAIKSVTDLFGNPVPGFTVEELAFTESNMDMAYWFGRPDVLILNVNRDAYNDTTKQLYYQLGHEITHTLGPMGHAYGRNATVIEEGAAEYHAREFTGDNTGDRTMSSCGKNYNDARDLVEKIIIEFGQDCIKKLRAKQPYLSKLTKHEIVDVLPVIDDTLAEQLASPFAY